MAQASRRADARNELLSKLPKGGICAEIGVWGGGFSEAILEQTQPRALHLVDPWSFQPEFKNSAFGRGEESRMEEKYQSVCERFKGDDRVTIHRMMSDAYFRSLPDHSLDWVYLDGNHNFEVVWSDLKLALKKVKPNGFIGGDDLLWNVDKGAPVRTAVRKIKRRLGAQTLYFRMGQQYLFDLQRDPLAAAA